MKTQLKNLLYTFVLSATVSSMFTSCKDDEQELPKGKYETGVFISNEGPFQNGTGTISFLNRDSSTIENDIFEAVNNRPLGNIVQSVYVHNDKAYIVVNNADKIEVVNANTFEEAGVINNLKLPRYFLPIDNNKAYVSQWGDGGVNGAVKVIDLSTNTVTKTITVGNGAENMLLHNGKVYVANSGAFGYDSTLTIINAATDNVEATITVGANPNSLVKANNGNIYVLCGGKYKSDFSMLEIKGSLAIINSSNNTVSNSFSFSSDFAQPNDLIINETGNKMYYNYDGKVYTQDATANNLQLNVFANRGFYSLGFDNVSDYIYAGDAGTFSSNGMVLRYNINGTVVDSFEAGIAPNGFFFR